MSKSTGRAIRICFVEVSPDLVLLDIRKSIFNVLLPEEEDLLLPEEEDLLLLEEEDLLLLEEEDLLLLEDEDLLLLEEEDLLLGVIPTLFRRYSDVIPNGQTLFRRYSDVIPTLS